MPAVVPQVNDQSKVRIVKVYKLKPQENSVLTHPLDQNDFEKFNMLINGNPQLKSWVPIEMKIIHSDEGHKLDDVDAPWLGSHALILKAGAATMIKQILSNEGELLPLDCRECDLFVYNPLSVIDALDERASTVIRFSESKQIMHIKEHSFRNNIIGQRATFKIPNLRVSPIFVTEPFIDMWQSKKLSGLEFDMVWRSDN